MVFAHYPLRQQLYRICYNNWYYKGIHLVFPELLKIGFLVIDSFLEMELNFPSSPNIVMDEFLHLYRTFSEMGKYLNEEDRVSSYFLLGPHQHIQLSIW